MLSPKEKKEIQEETKLYPYPAAACIDALENCAGTPGMDL